MTQLQAKAALLEGKQHWIPQRISGRVDSGGKLNFVLSAGIFRLPSQKPGLSKLLNNIIGVYVRIQKVLAFIILFSLYYYYYYHHHYHETNYVPREYSVAAILLLLFVVLVSLILVLNLLYFYISTFRSVCVQCPIWLFSVVP